jgi:hypothetical protein
VERAVGQGQVGQQPDFGRFQVPALAHETAAKTSFPSALGS